MHEYDTALKSVLQRQLRGGVFATWLGVAVTEWLNTETPEVRTSHADLLGRNLDGGLIHIELQSTNDPDMALRMAEYQLAIYRVHREFPRQIVLYVGSRNLRMESTLSGPDCNYRCRILDIREIDAEPLLASDRLDDNVIAILAHLSGKRHTIRRVLQRIAAEPPEVRSVALNELTILAGLRHFGGIIESERQTMPILDDILDHDLLGPIIRKSRLEGERHILLNMLNRRFGDLTPRLQSRFEAMDVRQLEALSLRLFDAKSVEELFS